MPMQKIQGKPFKIYEHGVEKDGGKEKTKIGHRLPEIELISSDVADIKDWKIGESIILEIEVKPISVKSMEKGELIEEFGPLSGENDDNKKETETITVAKAEIIGVNIKEKKETLSEKVDKKMGQNPNNM